MPLDSDTNEGDGLCSTSELLARVRTGDELAAEELVARFTPPLRRLLHARLPAPVRGLLDTDDLLQEVFARALGRLEHFEYRGPGLFWSYLRRIGLNQVTELARRNAHAAATPATGGPSLELAASDPGPVGRLVKQERFRAFETALECLSEVQRRALLMRMELRLSYEVIALECEFPSPDAARMSVCRAVERVIERMSKEGHGER